MSRTRQTASPNTTEESNSSAVGNVGILKDCSSNNEDTRKPNPVSYDLQYQFDSC